MRAFGFGAEDPVCLDVEHYTDVYDDPLVPQDFWAYHQRITQYEGDHEESHGGVPLTMDKRRGRRSGRVPGNA